MGLFNPAEPHLLSWIFLLLSIGSKSIWRDRPWLWPAHSAGCLSGCRRWLHCICMQSPQRSRQWHIEAPSDEQRRQEDVYQQLARQQLMMDKMAASCGNRWDAIHIARSSEDAHVCSELICYCPWRLACRRGQCLQCCWSWWECHPSASVMSPALQQGTAAAAAEIDEHSACEKKGDSDLVYATVSYA